MKKVKVLTADEAVMLVKDGDTVSTEDLSEAAARKV